jgi:hypothetical protein
MSLPWYFEHSKVKLPVGSYNFGIVRITKIGTEYSDQSSYSVLALFRFFKYQMMGSHN